jgi:hypothetical protein
MEPRIMRKADETEEPIMPPTSPKASNWSLIAAELAATTMDGSLAGGD